MFVLLLDRSDARRLFRVCDRIENVAQLRGNPSFVGADFTRIEKLQRRHSKYQQVSVPLVFFFETVLGVWTEIGTGRGCLASGSDPVRTCFVAQQGQMR